jgi:DNA polymerase-3 subunit delta'
LARWLAGEDGDALRAQAEALVRTALGGTVGERPWLPLLASAKDAGRAAAEQTHAAVAEQAEQLPPKEARRHLREGAEAERRAERRRRSAVLDLGLRLAELWLRDVWCLAYGVSDAVHASDREAELRGFLAALQTGQVAVTQRGAEGAVAAQAPDVQAAEGVRVALGKAVELVAETRMRLALNVSEELALEALVYRLAARLRG